MLTFFFDELLGDDCKLEICPSPTTDSGADCDTESTAL